MLNSKIVTNNQSRGKLVAAAAIGGAAGVPARATLCATAERLNNLGHPELPADA